MHFHHLPQLDAMDCGAACLRMIAWHYGKRYSAEQMRRYTSVTREGVSMLGISDAAEHIGMRTMAVKDSLQDIEKEKVISAPT